MSLLVDGYISEIRIVSPKMKKDEEKEKKINNGTKLKYAKNYILSIKEDKHIGFHSKEVNGFGTIREKVGNNIFLVSGHIFGDNSKGNFQFQGTAYVFINKRTLDYELQYGTISYSYNIFDVRSIFTKNINNVSVSCKIKDSILQSIEINNLLVLMNHDTIYSFPSDMPLRYHRNYPLHVKDLNKYLYDIFPFVLSETASSFTY